MLCNFLGGWPAPIGGLLKEQHRSDLQIKIGGTEKDHSRTWSPRSPTSLALFLFLFLFFFACNEKF